MTDESQGRPPRFFYAVLSQYPALERRLVESLEALEGTRATEVFHEEEGVKRQVVDFKSEALQ
jgi:hypothetical protein